MKTPGVLDARSMRAWLARYLDWLRVQHRSERSVDTSKGHIEQFFLWCDARGLVRPEEITKPILERYQRYLFHYRKANGKPLLFGTQYGRLVHVRLYFRWLARQNAILWNPASDLDLPRRQRKLPAQVFTVAEVEKVMQVPDVRDPLGLRDRAILEVLFATGMRRSELVNLDVYDVDGERGTVHVRRGKGNRDRVVPVGDRALAWLGKYLDTVRPEVVVGGTEDALFLTKLGDRMQPEPLSVRVKRYVKDSGVGKRGACHAFRHAMATAMLEGGADVRYVQEMLGHAALETTAIYTRVSVSKLREVHMAAHPTARLGKPRLRSRADETSPSTTGAGELLADLAEEAEDDTSTGTQ